MNDLKISRLKFNSAQSSLGFSEMTFGSPLGISDTDLVIRNEDGDRRLDARDNIASNAAMNIMHTTSVSQDFEAAAYALISHGPDGEGSYIVNGTTDRRDNIDDALENPDEVANHSDDREVNDIRKIQSLDLMKNFDDIVMWDSQITLYNSLRNGSCEASQAL